MTFTNGLSRALDANGSEGASLGARASQRPSVFADSVAHGLAGETCAEDAGCSCQ